MITVHTYIKPTFISNFSQGPTLCLPSTSEAALDVPELNSVSFTSTFSASILRGKPLITPFTLLFSILCVISRMTTVVGACW